MRGQDHQQSDMFSYLSAPNSEFDRTIPYVPFEPWRSGICWHGLSIPPEKLLRAQLIQMLYSVRSERLLVEEIDNSILFCCFVGMNLDEPVWDPTVFTKNRDRLLVGDVAR